MNIGNVNSYRFEHQKRLLDSLLTTKRAIGNTVPEPATVLASAPAARDELILSVNARAKAKLPQEQQYLRDENGYILNDYVETAARRVHQRDYMNGAVTAALKASGIEIGDDERYEISVDSSHTVHVSGDNTEKSERIAAALNAAQVSSSDAMAKSYNTTSLGSLMFWHTLSSTNDFPVQVTQNELKKYQVDSAIKQWSGLPLSDLRFESGGIYTPDNRDLFDVISENVAKAYGNATKERQAEAAAAIAYIKDGLSALQKVGIANINDVEFKISLGSDGLSDIGLTNGFGVSQRDWYYKLLSLRSKTDADALGAYAQSIWAEPNAWRGSV